MKSKRSPLRRLSPLTIHFVLYIIFNIALWMSMLATFDYPGNNTGSFDVFKPLLVERMGIMILWGMLVMTHFSIHQIRRAIHAREQTNHLANIQPDRANDDLETSTHRLKDSLDRSEVEGMDDSVSRQKQIKYFAED